MESSGMQKTELQERSLGHDLEPYGDVAGDKKHEENDRSDVDDDGSFLLTDLPEVALVQVMGYLSLKERYYLSLTCRLFYDLFSHPKLWQVAHISLFTSVPAKYSEYRRLNLKAIMPSTMAIIVRKFSHLFQHLTLHMQGFVQPFDEDSRQLLLSLNNECRLESLSLQFGALSSTEDISQARISSYSNYKDLPLVLGLLRNATRLKRLSLLSWPLQLKVPEDQDDVFQTVLKNERLLGLESLSLFYIERKNADWSERIPILPPVGTVFNMVSRFRHLSTLSLRSPMLNDAIIRELATSRRRPLTLLQILVTFSRDSFFMEGYKIPDISSNSWSALRATSPELKVEFLVLNRIPQQELGVMLKPEVPLSSLAILSYGRCDAELIAVIAERYWSTLEVFVSKCDAYYCDGPLKTLASKCSKLSELVFHGEVSYQTIETIARLIKERGQEFERFEFKAKNITVEEINDEGGVNHDDVVIAREPDSEEYYLVGMRSWHRDEDARARKIDVMTQEVSNCLGYKWNPS